MSKTIVCQGVSASELRSDLTNAALIPDALPTEIQFMPPGVHRICPLIGGEATPITIKVDKALADRLNAELQKMRNDAMDGKGDLPFFDFNHEDSEAAAEVTELYWKGDELGGGIWARVKWTEAGKVAVLGKSYRRFSPQWTLNPLTHEVVGIPVNLGGLVNRAAFKTIRPVMAKGHAGGGREIVVRGLPSGEHELIAQARSRATEGGIPLAQAVEALARNNELYDDYRNWLLRLSSRQAPKLRYATAGAEPFLGEVQALQVQGLGYDQAVRSACAKCPQLYEGYRLAMRGIKPGVVVAY